MGMIDTGNTASRTIYDRVEYALNWMDRVITGGEFRNVLTLNSKIGNFNHDMAESWLLNVIHRINIYDAGHVIVMTFWLYKINMICGVRMRIHPCHSFLISIFLWPSHKPRIIKTAKFYST